MEEMTLKEWTIFFVKNQDILTKNLVNYKENKEFIVFEFKDFNKECLVSKLLDEKIIEFIKNSGKKMVVCSASKENLKFLIDNWSRFAAVKELDLIFANPITNKRWMIKPFIHDKICDDEVLKTGLESMFTNTF